MQRLIYEYSEVNHTKLKEYIIDTPLLHKYFKEDWKILKARQYCGILNYNGDDFYILPKVATGDNEASFSQTNSSLEDRNLDIFIYMLRFVYDIKLQNEDMASSKNQKQKNFMEIFVQLFASKLFRELQAGVYKEYITEQDNLTTLRGKYLINENLKYNFTNAKIYCEYDEFSMNNTLNSFFLFTIKTLLPFVKNKKLLKQCELIFDEVEYRHFDVNNLKDVHFHRLNARYKDSFEFGVMLLKKFIPLFERDKKSFAFLFDMNELFEKFIGKMYKEIDRTTNLQVSRNFGNLQLKPDIIVESKNLIIDCKYKVIEDDKIASRDDRYQMYVYANNFENIETTMLLYPKHFKSNEGLKRDQMLGDNGKNVKLLMRSIDLNFEECSYDEYVKEMQNRIAEILR